MTQLKILSWVAFALSTLGTFLNAYQIIWCWPVWCIANCIWIYYSIKTKQYSQLWLWIVFTLSNLYAWYIWSKL